MYENPVLTFGYLASNNKGLIISVKNGAGSTVGTFCSINPGHLTCLAGLAVYD